MTPCSRPELLKLLAEMGHDDAVVLADANFTAMSLGAGKTVLRLPGVGMVRTVDAVASRVPAGRGRAVSGRPTCRSAARPSLATARPSSAKPLNGARPPARACAREQAEAVERYAFYGRVKQAYAIVVTGETGALGQLPASQRRAWAQALRP